MQCPQCGYILQPFEAACPKCVALARTQQAAAPPPSTVAMPHNVGPPQQSYKVCPVCQQPAVLTMPVCRRCGYRYVPPLAASARAVAHPSTGYTPLPGYREAPAAAAERRAKRQAAVLIGACLGVLLLIVSTAFRFTSRPSHPSGTGGLSVLSGRTGGASLFGMVDSQQIDSRLTMEAATTGGDLEISLAWNTLSDIDLQVSDPSGEQIAADHPRSVSGGVQDVDANPTLLTPEGENRLAMGQIPGKENVLDLPESMVDMGKGIGLPEGLERLDLSSGGIKAAPHWTHQPIEHIYFARAPKGTYIVRAHCYSWREPDANPLPYTIEIRSHRKVVYHTVGTIGPASFVSEGAPPIEVCRFEYH